MPLKSSPKLWISTSGFEYVHPGVWIPNLSRLHVINALYVRNYMYSMMAYPFCAVFVRYNNDTVFVRYNNDTVFVRYNYDTVFARYNNDTVFLRYNNDTVFVRYKFL